MNPKSLVLGLLLLTSAAFAAEKGVLLMKSADKDGRETCTKAMIGDTKVTADSITYDAQQKTLECRGKVILTLQGGVMTAKDCTLKIGSETNVFLMNTEGIVINPSDKAETPAAKPAAH